MVWIALGLALLVTLYMNGYFAGITLAYIFWTQILPALLFLAIVLLIRLRSPRN